MCWAKWISTASLKTFGPTCSEGTALLAWTWYVTFEQLLMLKAAHYSTTVSEPMNPDSYVQKEMHWCVMGEARLGFSLKIMKGVKAQSLPPSSTQVKARDSFSKEINEVFTARISYCGMWKDTPSQQGTTAKIVRTQTLFTFPVGNTVFTGFRDWFSSFCYTAAAKRWAT